MSFEEFAVQLFISLQLDAPETYDRTDDLTSALGFDSLQMFELVLAVEELAGLMRPPVEMPVIRTMADAFGYYEEAQKLSRSGPQ